MYIFHLCALTNYQQIIDVNQMRELRRDLIDNLLQFPLNLQMGKMTFPKSLRKQADQDQNPIFLIYTGHLTLLPLTLVSLLICFPVLTHSANIYQNLNDLSSTVLGTEGTTVNTFTLLCLQVAHSLQRRQIVDD